MQITSNDDVNQLGIYAGVAGVGTVAGAAVVARATSPIYKKDKKAKKKDKAVAESVTSPISQKAVDRQRRGYRTEEGAKKAEASAFAKAAEESRLSSLAKAESAAYDEASVRNIWGNQQADDVMNARTRNDAKNHVLSQKRQTNTQQALGNPGGSFLDAPQAHTGTIYSAPSSNTPARRTLPGDSPNFRRTGSSSSPGRKMVDPDKQTARLLKIASKVR